MTLDPNIRARFDDLLTQWREIDVPLIVSWTPPATEQTDHRRVTVDAAAIAADYQSGMSLLAVAAKHGCSTQTVVCRLDSLGIERRPRGVTRGALLPSLRKSGHWPEIIAMRKDRKTYEEISQHFGVTRERIRQILNLAGRSDLCGHDKGPPPVRVSVVCDAPECNSQIEVTPGEARRSTSNYCSKQCGKRAQAWPRIKRARAFLFHRAMGRTWTEIGRLYYGDRKQVSVYPQREVAAYEKISGVSFDWAFPRRHTMAKGEKIPGRAKQAWDLRNAGHSSSEIADMLGYANAASAQSADYSYRAKMSAT